MREFFGDTIPEKVVVVSGFRYANSRVEKGVAEELPGLQTQREEQRQEQEEDPGAMFKVYIYIYPIYISHIYPIYIPYISHIFPIYYIYIPYISHIYPIYFPYISHIYRVYISHIYPIYIVYIYIPYIDRYIYIYVENNYVYLNGLSLSCPDIEKSNGQVNGAGLPTTLYGRQSDSTAGIAAAVAATL